MTKYRLLFIYKYDKNNSRKKEKLESVFKYDTYSVVQYRNLKKKNKRNRRRNLKRIHHRFVRNFLAVVTPIIVEQAKTIFT